ncbi:hypothetical protein PGTUg99_004921 [Puccinia graminis f. sp. tritici]|uniref:Retrotransposon gag domain-containing protein n=1 Tax=Puccinia graminis f. sp. tritici TaxID=56615 RepID=A0A5B0QE08_PUCGR|nr:hypothetical protein PGTUg99_004921 [Puccinia graminis f. sp. tritici]
MSDSSSPLLSTRMRLSSPAPTPPGQFLSPRPNYLSPSPSLPPLSPLPDNFQPRPIPPMSPTLLAATMPYHSVPDSPNIIPATARDDGVSSLISHLGLENQSLNDTILSHAQKIADLEIQQRRYLKLFDDLRALLPLSSQFMKVKTDANDQFLQVRNAIDSVNNSTNLRLDRVEGFVNHSITHPPVQPKSFRDPPYLSHIYFSGILSETKEFCFAMRHSLEMHGDNFHNEKHKVMWIAGYFRKPDGKLGDNCALYVWWRGLMAKNAHHQNLDPNTASSKAPFLLDELLSGESFLVAIETTFSNHKGEEEARKSLRVMKQGNTPIEEFNVSFNSLLYSVDLSEASKCDLYDEAINPKIIQLGILRGGWNGVTDLAKKQAMAVILAADVPGVALIDRLSQKPQPIVHKVQLPPKPDLSRAPPRLSDGVPMDIDAIAAELGFTYDAYRHECVLQHICHRCGGRYDSAHTNARRCPLDKGAQLSKPQILGIWRDWGGSAGDGIDGRLVGRNNGTSQSISAIDRWSSSSGVKSQGTQTTRGGKKVTPQTEPGY